MKDALARGRRDGIDRRLLSARTLRGTGREVAALATHVALYPMGVISERFRDDDRVTIDSLSPIKRGLLINDVVAAGTPILLVHGIVDNRAVFTMLRRQLARRGFGRIVTMNYSVLTADVRSAAAQLGRVVEQLVEETGYDRVHVVGHSLGGLVARYYVQRLGGDKRVHTLVTLGAPHSGTNAARLIPQRLVRQMRPGSDVMKELAEPAPGCATRFLAFWSDLDQIIIPKSSARLDHPDLNARNVLLRGVGHLSLPIDRRVVHEIAATLAQLDEGGEPTPEFELREAHRASHLKGAKAKVKPGGPDKPGRASVKLAPKARKQA